MYWASLLHIYQPPGQKKQIINQVVKESYEQILSILEARPKVRISLNICACLTEQLIEYGHQGVVERIKKLAEKGQIELTGSAKYHPILPLLPETEVIRQIKLNEDLNQKYFGKIWRSKPKGFFLPELAYNKKTGRIIQSLGYQWIVLDEIARNGKFGQVLFNQVYETKDLFHGQKKPELKIIFRNRGLSLLFFGKWLDSLDKFFSAVKNDKRSSKFLITAFDGENLGHHRKHLAALWAKILDQPEIQTITYSDYLQFLRVRPAIDVIGVEPLPSSWSTEVKDLEKDIFYPLWQHPKNQLHRLQWQITNLVIKMMKESQDNPNYKKARGFLDQALASDQYWWASAKPWWNPGIIERGVQNFVQISRLLEKNVSPEIKNRIVKIARDIFNELERRKKSGHYKIIEKIGSWK